MPFELQVNEYVNTTEMYYVDLTIFYTRLVVV